jgi:hypothetical protein
VPVRHQQEGSLPVIQSWSLNFIDGFDCVPADDVLDQVTISTVLAAVDGAFCDEQDMEPGRRFDLADLLISGD